MWCPAVPDIERVYVSSVAAGTYAFACSTKSNRPGGGARHVLQPHPRPDQRGGASVRRRARRPLSRVELADGEPSGQTIAHVMDHTRPAQGDTKAAAPVFSRFLRHLAYLELAPTTAPLPEMQWFPPTRAVA